MSLGLHETTHDAERPHSFSILHQKSRNDRVKGLLSRSQAVFHVLVQSKICPAVLQRDSCPRDHDAGIVVDGKGQSRIWGDRIVIDWKEEAEKTYGFRVDVLRRGRGSWILETDLGLRLLKEYRGSVNRLEFEEAVLQSLDGMETLKADQYVRNSEGELLSTAEDGTRYIVKEWFADRECDLKDEREVLSAVRALALLHRQFRMIKRQETWNMRSMISLPLFEAMRRHNRELKKARTFIRGKRKKNEFELRVIGNFEIFAAQAVEAERGMERLYEIHGKEIADGYAVCHGEPDYHHILIGNGYTAVTEFNQMHLGVQMEDLYYFLRKIMEKHDWNERLGRQVMESYERVLPVSEVERQVLYYLFLYPEKYWKQSVPYMFPGAFAYPEMVLKAEV